jgi:hypothetical protein
MVKISAHPLEPEPHPHPQPSQLFLILQENREQITLNRVGEGRSGIGMYSILVCHLIKHLAILLNQRSAEVVPVVFAKLWPHASCIFIQDLMEYVLNPIRVLERDGGA